MQKKCHRDELFTDDSKDDYEYKGSLSGLSLKSERISFSCDSTPQSLLAPRGLSHAIASCPMLSL